jgi:ADP-heptose:LPS heptosyltransferase
MKRALIIRRSCLGDVLCAEPFIAALRKAGYQQIHFEADTYSEVIANHPHLTPGKPEGEFDTFDLTNVYELRLQMLMIDAYLEPFGLQLSEEEKKPTIYLTEEEKKYAENKLGNDNWVVLDISYPGGPLGRAHWPISYWEPILEFLKSQGYKILWISHNRAAQPSSIVDLDIRGFTTLRELFALIHRCKLFLGMDSGPMHVAQAFDVPGVGVFNPIHPATSLLLPGTKIHPVHRVHGGDIGSDEIIQIYKNLTKKPANWFGDLLGTLRRIL